MDHGFEYIEINEASLIESHSDRDKVGLPRVIEALQSVMWSTAQKKILPRPKSVADAAIKPPLPPITSTNSENTTQNTTLEPNSTNVRQYPIPLPPYKFCSIRMTAFSLIFLANLRLMMTMRKIQNSSSCLRRLWQR